MTHLLYGHTIGKTSNELHESEITYVIRQNLHFWGTFILKCYVRIFLN